MSFLHKVWWLLKPFHKHFYIIFLITAIFEAIRMAGPFFFGRILDLLVKSEGLLTFETAFYVVLGLAGVRITAQIIDYIADLIILRFLFDTEKFISTAAYEKLVDLSLDYHEKESTGKKISLLNRGTDKLLNLINGYVFEFQPVVLQLIVSSILIFTVNWRIGLIFTLSLAPFILITFNIFRTIKKIREKRHDAYDLSSGEIGDTMTNITVVKGFAQEKREIVQFSAIHKLIRELLGQETSKRMLRGYTRNFLVEIFYIVLLIMGLFEIRAGVLTIGGLVFLINLVERSYSNIYRLGRIYIHISEAQEPVDRLTNLMNAKSTISNIENPIIPQQFEGQIRFKNITFSYQKRTVLKNLNFNIPAGSFTALVGKSGSGKSTIAKLLSRYYDPNIGEIIIDDKYNLKQLELSSYRKHTAIVFQDSPVPNRKIWEIIAYSAGKTSFNQVKDKVITAAKLAHAHEFIMDFDDNYQTPVGERGVRLSGGQKQRLAIARALFAEPKILIMDEPTSHLDTLSESLIQKALEEISKKRNFTKIVIAHRLSTVQRADQILVMEKGRLVESGTHTQLIKQKGVYAQIVAQSELKG